MKPKSELVTTILGGDQLGRGTTRYTFANPACFLSNNFPLSVLLCVVFDVNNEMLGPMIELVPLL